MAQLKQGPGTQPEAPKYRDIPPPSAPAQTGIAVEPTAFEAKFLTTGREAAPPNPAFKSAHLLFVREDAWSVLNGEKIVPAAVEGDCQPGIHGNYADRDTGQIVLEPMIREFRKRGYTEIPWGILASRGDVPPLWRRTYLQPVPGMSDCAYHVCQVLYSGSHIVETDYAALGRWWDAVLEELSQLVGRPWRPSDAVLKGMIAERSKLASRSRETALKVPGRVSRQAEALDKEIAVIQAEIDRRAKAARPPKKEAAP